MTNISVNNFKRRSFRGWPLTISSETRSRSDVEGDTLAWARIASSVDASSASSDEKARWSRRRFHKEVLPMTRQRKVILGATGVSIALITVIAFLRVHDQVASSTLGRLRVELPAKQVRAVVASLGSAARRQPAQPAPTSTVNAPPAPQQGASNRELAEQWLTAVVTYREPDRGDVLNKLDQALVERGASMVGALARDLTELSAYQT